MGDLTSTTRNSGTVGTVGTVDFKLLLPNRLQLSRSPAHAGTVGTVPDANCPNCPRRTYRLGQLQDVANSELKVNCPNCPTVPRLFLANTVRSET